jgi:hypothetical protein
LTAERYLDVSFDNGVHRVTGVAFGEKCLADRDLIGIG